MTTLTQCLLAPTLVHEAPSTHQSSSSVDVTVGNKNTLVSTAQSQSDKVKDATNVCKDMSVSTAQSESNIAFALPCRSDATKAPPPTPVNEALSQHHSNNSGDVTADDKDTSGLSLPALHYYSV
ncbi:hypothetical protein BDR03DRAFT_1016315 [Suillus americanus]|nr:hypothetical protein BDR03DRAFT_1016315 [Suillus americanus]